MQLSGAVIRDQGSRSNPTEANSGIREEKNEKEKEAEEEAVRQKTSARIQRAETVLQSRTSQILLVLEQCADVHNTEAIFRTADSFGIQHVWVVTPVEFKHQQQQQKQGSSSSSSGWKSRRGCKGAAASPLIPSAATATATATGMVSNRVTKGTHQWLSIREFPSTRDCIQALRENRRTIWATDLSCAAVRLEVPPSGEGKRGEGREDTRVEVPTRLALVMGREVDGLSAEMLQAADQRVYVPMFGFAESFNVSVATALALQTLFALCPQARGQMSAEERASLRAQWFESMLLSSSSSPSSFSQDQVHSQVERLLKSPPPCLCDLRRASTPTPYCKKRRLKQIQSQR